MDEKPWLSVLLPSRRLDGLGRALRSLVSNATDFPSIEIVIVAAETRAWPYKNIRTIVTPETNVAALFEIAYARSRAAWVFFANDDTVMETRGWDDTIRRRLPADGVGLLWPNDRVFHNKLACFPVVSRIVLDRLLPFGPVKHYTIDAAIMDIVPSTRRVYLPDVVLHHLKTDDVPADQIVATLRHDQQHYRAEAPRRAAIRQDLEALIT